MIYMTKSVTITLAEAALNQLHNIYRKIDFTNGSLFFCTMPNGLTFDLFAGTNGSIRLWRFIASVPIDKSGVRFMCRKPEYPNMAIGFETTEEGDLSLFAEQTVDADDPKKEHRILKMIDGYSEMVSTMDFRNVKI